MSSSGVIEPTAGNRSAETPSFCDGLLYLREVQEGWNDYETSPLVTKEAGRVREKDASAAYQTMLAADAMRYLTLQMTASKSSGHPGGFASSAEAVAALVMLGQKNIVTEVGHHAPGYYSLAFLDSSLEEMKITNVRELCNRFREQKGLLGHITPAIPGMVAPAGPLGQGEHFAMALAFLHKESVVPVTIGDGGIGEPYVMSGILHFHTAFPQVTNFLPILIWNGYSQEHSSMCSTWSNAEMERYFRAHAFEKVLIVDAKEFDDSAQEGAYVDSTRFSLGARVAFTRRVLEAIDEAAKAALSGTLTAVVIKQLKGSGAHVHGSKAHNLTGAHSLEHEDIVPALERRALSAEAWELVRANFVAAAGGPATERALTERERPLPDLGTLPIVENEIGAKTSPTTAFGELAAAVGKKDPNFVVANADGNEASGMMNINRALGIRHPITDDLYEQRPTGQVYEPLSEDACAGLTSALTLHGGRSLWCSYESFAVNGLPVWQTVTQALAELRRPAPSAVALFTAGALEQGRNGWTHQRPELEGYFASLMRNGNVYPLFPVDANSIQACYEWALGNKNGGVAIFASKNPVEVRTTLEQSRAAVEEGALLLSESSGSPRVTLAFAGDMVGAAVVEAADRLAAAGIGVRVVAVVNPRRLYRAEDVAWEEAAAKDGEFLSQERFDALFGADALIGITGGASGILEPLLLRSGSTRADIMA